MLQGRPGTCVSCSQSFPDRPRRHLGCPRNVVKAARSVLDLVRSWGREVNCVLFLSVLVFTKIQQPLLLG